jgi:signal transduction histidine kinase
VTNAVKHGSPSRVRIEASVAHGELRLVVADDGSGGAAVANGTGLMGLADRVQAQGGTLRIHSPPGAGTRIEAEIPCGS